MITFLTSSDFDEIAQQLDYRRLGKQRIEALQILNCILTPNKWQNHPAVKMWSQHPYTLARYGHTMCVVWYERGYNDNLRSIFAQYLAQLEPSTTLPHWLSNPLLHRSHQSNLIRKDPLHYRHFWPDVPDHYAYYWPTSAKRYKVVIHHDNTRPVG